MVDVRSRDRTELVRSGGMYADPRFSPDGRWVAFHEIVELPRRQIFIIPVRSGPPAPTSEWIPVTDGSAMDRFPTFSPDGNLLYFISERDGFRCIAAQRLDPATKRPSGSMFYAYHFHGAQRSMMNFQNANWSRISVARDKVVFSLAERTGNIWMMKLPELK